MWKEGSLDDNRQHKLKLLLSKLVHQKGKNKNNKHANEKKRWLS
jgi:hypothetical protein